MRPRSEPQQAEHSVKFSLGMFARACAVVAQAAPAAAYAFMLISLLSSLGPATTAWLTKFVLDDVSSAAPVHLAPAVALAAVGLATAVLPYVSQLFHGSMERSVGSYAQGQLFAAVNRFVGLATFENPRFLDRLELAKQAGSSPSEALNAGVAVVRSMITCCTLVLSLLVLNPVMAAVLVVAAVPAIVVELQLSRRRVDNARELSEGYRQEFLYRELLTDLRAAKEIRLFGIGWLLRDRMMDARRSIDEKRAAFARHEFRGQGALASLSALVSGGGLVWAISKSTSGRFGVGDIAMFVVAVGGVQAAINGLIRNIAAAHSSTLLFGHYEEIMRDAPQPPASPAPGRLHDLLHGIEFRDVWFRYTEDGPWALTGVNLFIPQGQRIGLVGENGAGKSTFIKLLCRFYEPTRGSIFWDGLDLRELDPVVLRRRISAVFQDYMTYELTAAENIGLGDIALLADRSAIVAAGHRAGVHHVLAQLPDGYDTILSRIFFRADTDGTVRGGVLLSGGQWQRVALARAFLRQDADLFILDEPSSGLDAAAEATVVEQLNQISDGRTSILISHRLSTIKRADIIVVLDGGVVAEHGSHRELIDQDGIYAGMFALQAAGYREPDTNERQSSAAQATP